MYKQLILLLFFSISSFIYAQENNNLEMKSWYQEDLQTSKIYGVGSFSAQKKINKLKIKPTPIIVAVIDSGIDAEHEDLKDNMWVNPKEIANNNLDDDKNGYVDDLHGWNFLGNVNGENVSGDSMELTRLYSKYKAMFESNDEALNKLNIENNKKTYEDYLKIKEEFVKKFISAKRNYDKYSEIYLEYENDFKNLTPYLQGKVLNEENTNIVNNDSKTPEAVKKSLINILMQLNRSEENKTMVFDDFKTEVLSSIKEGLDHFSTGAKYHYNTEFDSRTIIKDNYNNLLEKGYGNNNVKGPDALHGTHVAGIISAVQNNNKGLEGIAGNHVKIMSLRAVPDGDERDKDVANAIIYAADNGAKIVNMSFGKGYSPDKERVWEAMNYAEKKGVLLIHAAGNDDSNIDTSENYPTNYKSKSDLKEVINNFITVGASTVDEKTLKSSFSNYGLKELDVFAPGSKIYSTTPENNYKFLQGTSMASPVVAGCAALLWSYFPKLKANEVKEILMLTSNKNEQLSKISKSKGVIDVNKAIDLALKKYKVIK